MSCWLLQWTCHFLTVIGIALIVIGWASSAAPQYIDMVGVNIVSIALLGHALRFELRRIWDEL